MIKESITQFETYSGGFRIRTGHVSGFSEARSKDQHKSFFCLQVLEDGSVVHINKTTISDTDEDGNRCSVRFAWTRHNDIEKLKIGILKQDKLFSLVIVYYLFILSFPSHFISVSSSTNLSSTQSAMARMVSEVFAGKHFLFLLSDSKQNLNLCCSRLQCRLLL